MANRFGSRIVLSPVSTVSAALVLRCSLVECVEDHNVATVLQSCELQLLNSSFQFQCEDIDD